MEILPHIFGLLLNVKNCNCSLHFDLQVEQKLKFSSLVCVCVCEHFVISKCHALKLLISFDLTCFAQFCDWKTKLFSSHFVYNFCFYLAFFREFLYTSLNFLYNNAEVVTRRPRNQYATNNSHQQEKVWKVVKSVFILLFQILKPHRSGKSTYFTQFWIVYFAFDILAGLNFHDKLAKISAMTFLLVSYDIEILTLPGYLQWQKPFWGAAVLKSYPVCRAEVTLLEYFMKWLRCF